MYNRTKAICDGLGTEEYTTNQRRKQTKMDEYVVMSSCGTSSDLSSGDHLRQRLFFPALDRMLQELESRFSGVGECEGPSSQHRDADSKLSKID